MLSLKWGEVLSTLLPGALAVVAMAPFFPLLQAKLDQIASGGWENGVALMIASALAGGLLEAFTRITWEKYFLVRLCPNVNVLPYLTTENIDLYERGVQGSYKYATFYANFAWATALLFGRRIFDGTSPLSIGSLILGAIFLILLRASFVQWTYYVNYNRQVFYKQRIIHAGK